jgi:uridine kinase
VVRVGISGAHGTGKTTLAEALCRHLPGHVTADEPYYLLEEDIPVLELSGPLDGRLDAILAALGRARSPSQN